MNGKQIVEWFFLDINLAERSIIRTRLKLYGPSVSDVIEWIVERPCEACGGRGWSWQTTSECLDCLGKCYGETEKEIERF